MSSPTCKQCSKPTSPVFATEASKHGQCMAWYCMRCNSWEPPTGRECKITKDWWDHAKNANL